MSDGTAGGTAHAGLAEYQSALLEVLHAGGDPAQMVEDIVSAAARNDLPVGSLDPALVSVAGELTRTWGRLDR